MDHNTSESSASVSGSQAVATTQPAEVSAENLRNSLVTLERLAEGEYQNVQMELEDGIIVKILVTYGNEETTDVLVLFHHFALWSQTGTRNVVPFRNETTLLLVEEALDTKIRISWHNLSDFYRNILGECWHYSRSRRMEAILTDSPVESQDDLFECAICLEESVDLNTVTTLECQARHRFHRYCIQIWLEQNDHCPMCRAQVLN